MWNNPAALLSTCMSSSSFWYFFVRSKEVGEFRVEQQEHKIFYKSNLEGETNSEEQRTRAKINIKLPIFLSDEKSKEQ